MAYREDKFLDIRWRWDYVGARLRESSLTPYCPVCFVALTASQLGHVEPTTYFICEECGFRREVRGSIPHVVGQRRLD